MNTWWKKALTSPVIHALGRQKERKTFCDPPILIGGCARSGTSLLLSILSAHPHIHAIPVETDAFTAWDAQGRPVRIDRLYRQLLGLGIKPGATRWCEKRPYNVRYIPEIINYFGGHVQFIHMVRDPRAVCTSFHPAKPETYWVSPERYLQDVTLGLAHADHASVYTLKYEDLVADTEKEIVKLCSFLQVPCDEAIRNWYEYATVRQNRAWFEPLEKIKADRGWEESRHDERVSALLRNELIKQLISELGYV